MSLREPLLSEEDVGEIERACPGGLTSKQIVDLFESRGVRLSEATFRKYVQMGMLPRSHRIGRKGKHRGSCGIYPAVTVRRVNTIKRLIALDFTIEDIQKTFFRQNEIETLARGFSRLFDGFERELTAPELDSKEKRFLARQLIQAKKNAGDLVKRMSNLDRKIARPLTPVEAKTASVVGGAGERW